MKLSNEYETIKQAFTASSTFSIIKATEQQLVATRLSHAPKRGIFRLLIPRANVVITNSKAHSPVISVRPDALAIFITIMFLGGVSGEIFMDRSLYPRDYPPEFIYGMAILYIGLLIVEIFNTKKQVQKFLKQSKP